MGAEVRHWLIDLCIHGHDIETDTDQHNRALLTVGQCLDQHSAAFPAVKIHIIGPLQLHVDTEHLFQGFRHSGSHRQAYSSETSGVRVAAPCKGERQIFTLGGMPHPPQSPLPLCLRFRQQNVAVHHVLHGPLPEHLISRRDFFCHLDNNHRPGASG